MIISVEKIYKMIDKIAPFSSQDSWDNSGLLIGSQNKIVNRVLLALDITEDVVEEAVNGGYDLVITHHPLIFKGLKQITEDTRIGRLITTLIRHDIALISAHTNIDLSFDYGTSRYISNLYGLEHVKPLNELGYGVVGDFSECMNFDTFILKTKEIFNTNFLRVGPKGCEKKQVKTLAICSGSASEYIRDAITNQVDVYITSDLKYHEYQIAIGSNALLVDVGHYESETIYLDFLMTYLTNLSEEKNYDVIFHSSKKEFPIIDTI